MRTRRITLPLLILLFVSGNAGAADSGTRYQAWRPPVDEPVQRVDDTGTQPLIDELTTLIDEADQARAADRRFISDLRDILARYDWPWRVEVLREDFTDGHVSSDPAWSVTSGDLRAERGLGLYSKVQAAQPRQPGGGSQREELAAVVLGALLEQAMTGDEKKQPATTTPADHAEIVTGIPIGNAFAMDIELDTRADGGRIEFGVFQGSVNGSGYRLAFLPGGQAGVELLRAGRHGLGVIDTVSGIDAPGNQVHRLQWTRDLHGVMVVRLDGKQILKTSDRGLRDPFGGLSITNHEGEFAVREIAVSVTR